MAKLKILVQHPEEFNPVIQGLKAAFTILEDCQYWKPKEKNIYDIVHEYGPDVIICNNYELPDDAIYRLQTEQKDNAFKLISVNTGTQIIDNINNILNMTYSTITNLSSNVYGLKPAANVPDYGKGIAKPEYKCGFLLFNNIENPKNTDVEESLANIFKRKQNPSLKIFGKYSLNYPEYLGQLTNYEMSCAIQSCETFIDIDYSMLLDVLYNKKQYYMMKGIELIPLELRELIYGVFQNQTYTDCVQGGYEYAKKNTYFHRAIEILKNLDYNENVEKATISMDNFLTSLENK